MAEVGHQLKPDQGKGLEMFRGFGSGVRRGSRTSGVCLHSKRVLAPPHSAIS